MYSVWRKGLGVMSQRKYDSIVQRTYVNLNWLSERWVNIMCSYIQGRRNAIHIYRKIFFNRHKRAVIFLMDISCYWERKKSSQGLCWRALCSWNSFSFHYDYDLKRSRATMAEILRKKTLPTVRPRVMVVLSLYYTVCHHGSAIVFLKAAQTLVTIHESSKPTKVKLSYDRSSPHSPTRFAMYFCWFLPFLRPFGYAGCSPPCAKLALSSVFIIVKCIYVFRDIKPVFR